MPEVNRLKRPARAKALPPALLALTLIFALSPLVADASTKSLAFGPGGSVAAIGGRHTTALVSVAVVVPTALPVDVGLQFRSSSRKSGYRAALAIGTDGSVSGTFSRVSSGVATTILPSTPLGLTVQPGESLRLEATVAGSTPVWLYLRAWKGSASKPTTWQLAVSDSSSKRYKRSGKTYLWASGTTAGRLSYGSTSVSSFSATRAAAIGVTPAEPSPDTFGIAVIPDTQNETNNAANFPFLNRVNWLVSNRDHFDLQYVLHTGDMVNWGWLDPVQYTRARAAIQVIRDAGLPYDLTVGNHDTKAVGWDGIPGSTGWGGSAYMYNPDCPKTLGKAMCSSPILLRETGAFNDSFPIGTIANVGGVLEANKIDNNWTSFRANNTNWLVLTLELWPRKAVVDWAEKVVAGHPEDNVIIQTHNYLDKAGRITTNAGGYGSTSPSYLYQRVVSKYLNVKLVFSGHIGGFTNRVDSRGGNPVLSYLGNQLSGANHNPVRIVSINTRTGDVFTTVQDPINQRVVSATSNRIRVIP